MSRVWLWSSDGTEGVRVVVVPLPEVGICVADKSPTGEGEFRLLDEGHGRSGRSAEYTAGVAAGRASWRDGGRRSEPRATHNLWDAIAGRAGLEVGGLSSVD